MGLLFTLMRFNLNDSISGNLEMQHNGHVNSEHILNKNLINSYWFIDSFFNLLEFKALY